MDPESPPVVLHIEPPLRRKPPRAEISLLNLELVSPKYISPPSPKLPIRWCCFFW